MSRSGTLARPAVGRERAFFWIAAGLFVWLLLWLRISSPQMLDDSLIHLRYAENLRHWHRITYDGVHPSFGTSSLLYVSLLAGLGAVWGSPLLPRVVSEIAYVTFFLLLARTLYRELQASDAPPILLPLAVGLLAITASPAAVRWLSDGMETSLVLLDTLLGVLLLRAILRAMRLPGPRSLALGATALVFGLLTVLLRVEMLSLVVVVAATAGLEIWFSRDAGDATGRRLAAIALLLAGALLAVLVIVFTMHALLPDTAIAKAYGRGYHLSPLTMGAREFVSSFSFGLGLVLFWSLGLFASCAFRPRRWASLPGYLLIFCILGPAIYRGQQVQGIRYFAWALLFPVLWELLHVRALSKPRSEPAEGLRRRGLIAVVALVVLSFAIESVIFYRIFKERGAALNLLRAQHLERLQGHLGLAEDVGFIGYFTQADICDPYGLINGRAAARLKYDDRLAHCVADRPEFVFGSVDLLQKVTHLSSLAGWTVCGEYNFQNVRKPDVHFLVVAPSLLPLACPGRGTPLAQAIPGLL